MGLGAHPSSSQAATPRAQASHLSTTPTPTPTLAAVRGSSPMWTMTAARAWVRPVPVPVPADLGSGRPRTSVTRRHYQRAHPPLPAARAATTAPLLAAWQAGSWLPAGSAGVAPATAAWSASLPTGIAQTTAPGVGRLHVTSATSCQATTGASPCACAAATRSSPALPSATQGRWAEATTVNVAGVPWPGAGRRPSGRACASRSSTAASTARLMTTRTISAPVPPSLRSTA